MFYNTAASGFLDVERCLQTSGKGRAIISMSSQCFKTIHSKSSALVFSLIVFIVFAGSGCHWKRQDLLPICSELKGIFGNNHVNYVTMHLGSHRPVKVKTADFL